MEALGQKLKQTRIERGIELVEVQEQTKIRARYLEAIEEGKWELLPGEVYAKGFVRSYAEYLGLDGQALLDEYGLAQTQVKAVDPTESIVQKSRTSKAASERKKSEHAVERKMWPQFAIGAGILAVLIVGYVFISSQVAGSHQDPAANSQQHINQSTATNTKQVPKKTQQTPQTPTLPPPKPAVVIKPLQNTNTSSSFSVTNSDNTISLHMTTPKGDCWVSVTADGKVIYSGTLTQGASQSWSANQKLEILTGNSAAVALEVNGQSVPTVNYNGVHTYSFQTQ